ncbi:hypothetical protein PVAND_011586 [Polypedilum vanderplanki]|uniref:GTP-binding protein REM 1 n=1 Tax=Polypedilum vanderplanki TaxID=319348 RepID=A0A9J6CJQ0_POLVA|nr:hypothetical protein PVAND_011586 [Polypedilum vanderplanki]
MSSWNKTPPPLSPRKAKQQQHSWDAPTINLYDPNREFLDETSACDEKKSNSQKKNSSSSATRKIKYNNKYCLPNTVHQMSDPGTYLKSPKSPNSQHFEFELSHTPKYSKAPMKTCTFNRRFYEDMSNSDSAPATLTSPMKKYEYSFVTPKHESSSGIKKFEYCLPLKTPENEKQETAMINKDLMTESAEIYNLNKNEEGNKPFAENKIYFATCSPRKNKIMKKRHYNVSPDGVSSLDDYTNSMSTTITYETNTPGRRMSITISDGNSSELSSEPIVITESLETSSLITQSTNCSHTTSSPLPSPSSSSARSLATTASCNTMESKPNRPKSLCQKIGEETDEVITSQENLFIDLQRRRHAINITSNPGYRALHNSHSTLSDKKNVDRTYSDSATQILKHRKSTSDLTNEEDYYKENENTMMQCTGSSYNHNYKHRRRGSSKGGLAYLVEKRDSRRGSRESVISQQTNISNEDIGPLTNFQQTQRGRQRRTSNFLELPVPDHIRPRVCSLPDRPAAYNPRVSEDLYRLRTFSISKGTVVNCGDSIISRRSKSNTSMNSTTSKLSERSPFDGSCCGGYTGNSNSSDSSETTPPTRYRVVMLGDSATGKTALVNQFMTSEYMHTYDASLDDEFGEKTVSILLDGEESELIFIDHPAIEMSVENSLSTYEPHACVIVYSIVQKSSFRCAEEILNYLWRENITKEKGVIVVGNKADLARSRVISTAEGKQLAASRDVKFIETSSGIQHNVDELLVGILKQIRLKETREKKQSTSKMKNSRTQSSLHIAKEILQKICFNQLDITKSKSCENLHVL